MRAATHAGAIIHARNTRTREGVTGNGIWWREDLNATADILLDRKIATANKALAEKLEGN